MTSSPPSSEEARRSAIGALREMLSALGNLQQLLRSRSVGPKALSPILPDVAAGCRPLLEHLQPVFNVGVSSPLAVGLRELHTQLSARVLELEAALQELTQRALSASTRLKAEAVVSQAVRNLGGALPLVELLSDLSIDAPPMDWIETLALSRTGDQAHSPGAVLANATLIARSEAVNVRLRPRSALNLAGLVCSLVYVRREPLRLMFEEQDGKASLRIDRVAGDGKAVSLWVPPVLDATGPCLAAAAAALSLNLAWQDGAVTLTW